MTHTPDAGPEADPGSEARTVPGTTAADRPDGSDGGSDGGTSRARSLLSSSAVMAAGTVVSRLSGFVRGILLAAALGVGLHADVFNIANTVPNMLYILLAGGVVNAVLVPQLVRSMRDDADGGEAYTNRVMTLAMVFLLVITVLLVVGAPLLMRVFLDERFYGPGRRDQLESAIAFARYCLPQVFFYGMFVLVGQVLNSRGRFGPMMWAPIANNVVSVAVLAAYLVWIGPARGAENQGGYSSGAELLLGLGSTLGIVLQLVVLVPYLRSAGIRFRPRFDFRGSGLGHTLRLGVWTVLFVVVNQVAFSVVVRLASRGTVAGGPGGGGGPDQGTGYTVYSNAYILTMVPHSIVTVSLATAMLPLLSRHAAEHDLGSIGRQVSAALRSSYALVVPVAALFAVMALDLSQVIWGYGAAANDFSAFAPTLAISGLGLVLFTAHYLLLRGFYALEQTRRVFFIQCGIAVTNVVAAVVLTIGASPAQTAPRLMLAYGLSYLVGAATSYAVLARTVGGLQSARLVRFTVRLAIVVAVTTAIAWGTRELVRSWVPGRGNLTAVLHLGIVGVVFVVAYLVLARALRLTEVAEVTSLVTRRLPGLGGRTRRRSTTGAADADTDGPGPDRSPDEPGRRAGSHD